MILSVVIPCYNSENTLKTVVENLEQVINKIDELDYQIILVNDCSRDGTYDVIKELARNNSRVKGINLANNAGQHNAIMVGFRYTVGDYVFVCSDDGQTPLHVIKEMMDKLDKEYDVVCIHYVSRGSRNAFRRFCTAANNIVTRWLIEFPPNIKFSVEFMAKRFVINQIVQYNGPFSYMLGLVFRTTHNVGNVKSTQLTREKGKSGYTLKKLYALYLNGFTAFSIKPLRVISLIGLLFSCTGFIVGFIFFIRKMLCYDILIGWTSMIIILLIASGLIMISLGIIGEYIGRIYMSINNTPQYVIKETINIE